MIKHIGQNSFIWMSKYEQITKNTYTETHTHIDTQVVPQVPVGKL